MRISCRALAKLFAGKFLKQARRALPDDVTLPTVAAGTRWVAEVRAVPRGGDTVRRYLGRYVHRTAIADGAIVACNDDTVTFRYRDSRSGERKTMTLPAGEFVRRFLQHVLPKGFHRVRTYGLLHPRHRPLLRQLQTMLADDEQPAEPPSVASSPRLRCPHCRTGHLRLVQHLSAEQCLAMLAPLARATPAARAPPRPLAGPSQRQPRHHDQQPASLCRRRHRRRALRCVCRLPQRQCPAPFADDATGAGRCGASVACPRASARLLESTESAGLFSPIAVAPPPASSRRSGHRRHAR